MKLNLKVIEAKNLPKVDVKGSCDGYCKIQFAQQKAQTRIINNSLSPCWRQDFSFDILDIEEDNLFIQLYDYDSIRKHDLISDLIIKTKSLKPGKVIDKWYTMNPIKEDTTPEIHLMIHIGEVKDTTFIEKPFSMLVVNIRVISVKDVDLGEYYVSLGYKENLMKETRKSTDLIWQQEFAFIMSFNEPFLLIHLKRDKNIIGKTRILIGYPEGQIEKKYFPLEGKGNIFLAIQITKINEKPFLNENFDELPPPNELTAYFRIIEGKSLLCMDSNGKNDAFYCTVVNLKTPKQIKKTQILFKTIDPKWNYFINVKVHDYNSDEIRISCYDYDRVGNNDLIGYKDFKVKDMGEGRIMDEWISISNGNKETGELHIMYQICTVGWKPFNQISIIPIKKIHIHIMDGYDIPKVDLIGKTDPYIRIKLNDQEFYEKTKVIDNSLTPVWDESFTLYSLCKNPTIQIELKDKATGGYPLIGTADIDLDDIEPDKTKEMSEYLIPAKGMKKGGRIHLYIELNSYKPFSYTNFTKLPNTGIKIKNGTGSLNKIEKVPTVKPLTLFVKVEEASDLKALDSNGLSDPFVFLNSIIKKKILQLLENA